MSAGYDRRRDEQAGTPDAETLHPPTAKSDAGDSQPHALDREGPSPVPSPHGLASPALDEPTAAQGRFRLLEALDTWGHRLHLCWLPGFWRLCDAYDLALGALDTPENFPRRHRAKSGMSDRGEFAPESVPIEPKEREERQPITYICKCGCYSLLDGSLLFVESTHPRGRIRVTRTVKA